jgi:Bor protein
MHPVKRYVVRAALCALLPWAPGCGYTYHFRDSTAVRGEEHNEWASYFLFGIVGEYEVNVKDFCSNGVYEIATGNNFLTWLVTSVTLGLYAPRKVNIWCSAGTQKTAFEVQFDRAGAPIRVTRQGAAHASSGAVSHLPNGRYGVHFEREVTQ